VIRRCTERDFAAIHAIVNDAAQAYRDHIPADRWHAPYMSEQELRHEIDTGVVFWGWEREEDLLGVMGLQDVEDVALIRHAYVATAVRRTGIGGRLLEFLLARASRPVLVGTWAAATWAIRFYERHGFRLVSSQEKERLLRKYWAIPDRQIETSVVLADPKWLVRGTAETPHSPLQGG
jgi:N-acetylglutamate synthase-like GNAT family acetyltransferase